MIEFGIQATAPPATTRNTEVAGLQRKLDIAEDDVALSTRKVCISSILYTGILDAGKRFI